MYIILVLVTAVVCYRSVYGLCTYLYLLLTSVRGYPH